MSLPSLASLILNEGTPAYGAYLGYPGVMNVEDFVQARQYGALQRMLKEKRWYFIGLCGPGFVAGAAVVRTGYTGTSFVYLYDFEQGQLLEHSYMDPGGRHTRFDLDPQNGTCMYETGKARVELQNRLPDGYRRVLVNIPKRGKELDIEVRLREEDQPVEPFSLVAEIPPDRYNYTAKLAGIPAEGVIRAAGKEYNVSHQTALASVDWTAGFPARHTFWNWSMGQGFDTEGRRVGWNFSKGVYDIGPGENVVWLEGKLVKLGKVRFDYNPKQIHEPWKVRSEDGEVDLLFHPTGLRQDRTNLLFIKSMFKQPFGTYSGTLRGADGTEHEVSNVLGIAEEHEALW